MTIFHPQAGIREVLTGNRTYYVRTDGNDANSGLSNNSAGAFLTIQKAWNVILTVDLNGYTATIKLGNSGTWTVGLTISSVPVGGTVILEGDTVTPSNTVINVTNNHCIFITAPAMLIVRYLKLGTVTSGYGIYCAYGGRVNVGPNIDFGATANGHIRAISGGIIANSGGYTISGSAQVHLDANVGGIIEYAGGTVTLTGTPAFSVCFVSAAAGSVISSYAVTFSGAATGKRYDAVLNAVINTFGGGPNYFPGSVAGAVGTGGQYA